MKIAVHFTNHILTPLTTTAAAFNTDVAISKRHVDEGSKSRKKIALVMTNEDMDEVIKIIKSVEDSGLLTDEISEAVEIESKQGKGGYLVSKFGSFNILT